MRFLQAGENALLVELADLPAALALYRALQARPPRGVEELVPAARTVLVHWQAGQTHRAELIAAISERARLAATTMQDSSPGRLVEIPVHYRGEDLAEVAGILSITPTEVIARHSGQPWQAAFAGFAPGFVYLSGGHPCFQVPRRHSPRTAVPAGSVALAGDFSAIYPSASPGGWQLIGTTPLRLWDLDRAEPALVQPGFRVQFVDAERRRVQVHLPPVRKKAIAPQAPTAPCIEFLRTGMQLLIQDEGRHQVHMGISRSGALDLGAMHAANRMAGNPPGTPVLESLMGGLRLRCHGRATLALAGAPAAVELLAPDGRRWPLDTSRAMALDDGDELEIGTPARGLRCYLAARGGWQVQPVLGSCATDTLARVGPPAPQAGDRLGVGCAVPASRLLATQAADVPAHLLPRPGDPVRLDIVLGPRTDWFEAEAVQLLQQQDWVVTPQSSRVGMRLQGAQPLPRQCHQELPSEGTVAGALQVPANGQPVLFLADHPLTGGYPVVAALARHHLNLAAQIPAGCTIRFRVVEPFFIAGAHPETAG